MGNSFKGILKVLVIIICLIVTIVVGVKYPKGLVFIAPLWIWWIYKILNKPKSQEELQAEKEQREEEDKLKLEQEKAEEERKAIFNDKFRDCKLFIVDGKHVISFETISKKFFLLYNENYFFKSYNLSDIFKKKDLFKYDLEGVVELPISYINCRTETKVISTSITTKKTFGSYDSKVNKKEKSSFIIDLTQDNGYVFSLKYDKDSYNGNLNLKNIGTSDFNKFYIDCNSNMF